MLVNITAFPFFSSPDRSQSSVDAMFATLDAPQRDALLGALRKLPNTTASPTDIAVGIFKLATNDNPQRPVAAWALLKLALEAQLILPLESGNLRAQLPPDVSAPTCELLKQIDQYVQQECPRWAARDEHVQILLATGCRNFHEFDIYEYPKLHDLVINKASGRLSLSTADYMFLRGLENVSALSRDQRHKYILWRASGYDKKMSFVDFESDTQNYSGMRVHGQIRERIELKQQIDTRRVKEVERDKRNKSNKSDSDFVANLKTIAISSDTDAAEKYFEALRRGSHSLGFRPEFWIENPSNYPGRPHSNIEQLGRKWFIAIRAFLKHRQKDFETEDQVRGALHVLADYVLAYLPMWLERNPESSIEFPASPRAFLRFFFVERIRFDTKEGTTDVLPKTLNELLPLRRLTPGSRNTDRIILQKFFAFLITYFEDNDDYVASGMKNPFRPDFDNEVAGRRAGKTDKIPFGEDVFPYLIFYGQSLEAFGEYLQDLAYRNNAFNNSQYGPKDGYHTEDWGFIPIFWYRNKLYQVKWIPNIYSLASTQIKSNPSDENGIYVAGFKINQGRGRISEFRMPHLGTVRLMNAMVEMGLRAQSLQWLDRRTFDKLAPSIAALSQLYLSALDQSYQALYVNTDKTHNEWDNLASWRVRRSLIAEARFQNSLADKFSDVEVPYENRKNSRFPPIIALFRNPKSASPISDAAYYRRWVEFLFGFQKFYNSKGETDLSGTPDELILLQAKEAPSGGRLQQQYYAIHTPHACRATFASNKDGELEVSEISYLLGHANEIVTNHYQIPNLKRLKAKLKALDDLHLQSSVPYDASGKGAAYLHPEAPNSPVRNAFQKSREQAISDFGFVPGVALWSLTDLDGDTSALDLLRQSPASIIKWHATHVCPVGNQCPKEIVANTGGMYRCGICPLAAKCIDHLPAIEAKQSELSERVRAYAARIKYLTQLGATQTELDLLHREMQLDTKERLGWKLSAEILRSKQRSLDNDASTYHVDQPELVRKQLQLIVRNRSEGEFFLQRIADSNAYPSLESPEVRARASRFIRLALAKQGRLEEAALLDIPAHSELAVFASLVKPFVEANGLSLESLAAEIRALPTPGSFDKDSAGHLLLEA